MGRKPKGYTKKDFENTFIEVLENENKIIRTRDKIKAKCKICGYEWEVRAGYLLKTKSCPKCNLKKGYEKLKIKDFDYVLKKFYEKWGKDKFDYSEANFVDINTPIKVKCLRCGRYFYVVPKFHYSKNRNYGCKNCDCYKKRNTSKIREINKQEFIKKAKSIYNDTFDYSKVDYVNKDTPVLIKCNICGTWFQTTPHSHLYSKFGSCPTCLRRKGYGFVSFEEFVKKAKKIHGNRYLYKKEWYQGITKEFKFQCKSCNKIFTLSQARYHIDKYKGCRYCYPTKNFDFSKPAILYYVKIIDKNSTYYKIGITNGSLKSRFRKEFNKIVPLKIWEFEKGLDAYIKEQEILKKYGNYRIQSNKTILENGGNTEIFVRDILVLDDYLKSDINNKEVNNYGIRAFWA